MKTTKGSHTVLLGLCAVVFLIINLGTLYNGEGWGGDFAQYIRHAKNIAEHKEYGSDIMLDPAVVSPPGFPLILSPLVKAFGLNFKILKIPNVIGWLVFVLTLHLILKRRLGEDHAFLGALVFFASPFFFTAKQAVISDVSFTCFATLAIYFFSEYSDHQTEENQQQRFVMLSLSVGAMFCAFFIRWAGISLFAAAILYLTLVKKNYKANIPVVCGLLICLWIQSLFNVSAAHHLTELPSSFGGWFASCVDQIGQAFMALLSFVFPVMTFASVPITQATLGLINVAGGLMALFILIMAGYRIYRRSISFLGMFFIVYFIGLLAWPLSTGPRYAFPIIGLIMLFLIECFNFLYKKLIMAKWPNIKLSDHRLISVFLVIILLHNIYSIAKIYNYHFDVINEKNMQEMVQWVKKNTAPDEHFMFFKPRVLGLLTDRVGAAFYVHAKDEFRWPARIKKLGIDYIVFDKEGIHHTQYLKVRQRRPFPLKHVWENSSFEIYEVIP